MSALIDAVAASDVRGVALALLRSERCSCTRPLDALKRATDAAASLTARSLRGCSEALDDARLYAGAWELLHESLMRLYSRRRRDCATRSATT